MSTKFRITLTGLFVAAATLLASASPPAQAAGWSTPQQLPGAWVEPSIAFDGGGAATAGYYEVLSATPPIATRSVIATRLPGGGWQEQLSIPTAGTLLPTEVDVAVAPNGAAAACISYLSIGPPVQEQRAVVYRTAGSSTWSAQTPLFALTAAGSSALPCDAVISPSGVAAALVGKPGASADQLLLATRTAATNWTTQEINAAGTDASAGDVGIDDAGNVSVAWRHRYFTGVPPTPDRHSIRVKTRTASNGILGVHQVLTPESGSNNAYSPQLAAGPGGAQAIGYQLASHLNVRYRSSPGAAWDEATAVFNDSTASSSSPAAVGVSPGGMAHVLFWRQGPSSSANSRVGVVRHGTFGAWTAPGFVSPGNAQSVLDPAVAFLGETAVPVFRTTLGGGGGDPGNPLVQAASWPAASGAPDPGVDILPPGSGHEVASVAADNKGSIAVVHTVVVSASERQAFITAYDASTPVLTDSSVPGTAVAGVPTQLRAIFSDLYSPIASTVWDFGDGTPQRESPTLIHAWAAPGQYSVTATARDTQGNEKSQAFSVVVTAAGAGPGIPGGPGVVLDTARPAIKFNLPKCKKKQKKAACKAMRKKRGAWTTVRGTASDNSGVARVVVVAKRKKAKRIKRKTITVTAKLSGGKWSARLKGIANGKWTITATAFDAAGNTTVAKRTVTLR